MAAIRQLDLQTRVSNDSLRDSIVRANRRANRATYATVASLAVDQALDTFGGDLADHDFIRAGLRSAPLLLLSPERKRAGFEGFLFDPRVIGLAGVVGIVAVGKFQHRDSGDARIEVLDRSVTAGEAGTLQAIVVDKNGRQLNQPITFSSGNPAILNITNASSGSYTTTAEGTGKVWVTASTGSRDYTFAVTVS